MKLIVGLGNPGPKYETTRHNAGFLILDELAEYARIDLSSNKFDGVYGRGIVFGEDAFLFKPMTYMNLSGKPVAAMMSFFKIDPDDVIVIFDDIDQASGKVKARVGGGHGGHNGIRSIIADTGCSDFHRIKVGVGRPGQDQGSVTNWVLGQFEDEELLALQETVFNEVLVRLKQIFQSKK